jgi:putative FmdB family regulatory protein
MVMSASPDRPDRGGEEEPVPTYQYVCTECGEPLEVVQKFSDDALTECPACTGHLRKIFSAAGIIFKGSGFYRTDSRSGNGSNGKSSPSTSPPSSSESGSSSSSPESSSDSSKSSSPSDSSSSSPSKAPSEKVA